ncbi:MAG TPA: phosphoribosyltransferase family protein [Edaphocola sp.]|nr:phosphoribosyltransferase family protein [Edaphocola sp.]
MDRNPVWMKFMGRLPVRKASAFLYFTQDGRVQRLLHQFKYEGRKDVGIFLSGLFAEDLLAHHWLQTIDIIMPLPIHAKKQRMRGYNQATVIAYALSRASGLPVVDKTALIKVSQTASQTRKSRLERLQNVQNAFHLRDGKAMKGKHILIVDDVLTTGATLEACALEVLGAQPSGISLATLAVASDI